MGAKGVTHIVQEGLKVMSFSTASSSAIAFSCFCAAPGRAALPRKETPKGPSFAIRGAEPTVEGEAEVIKASLVSGFFDVAISALPCTHLLPLVVLNNYKNPGFAETTVWHHCPACSPSVH